MEQFKKAHIIILPTKKETNIILDNGKLEFIKNKQIAKTINSSVQGFELYFTSNDEIKDGDWYYFNVGYASGIDNIKRNYEEDNCKKIIATTDESLKLRCKKCDDTKELDTGMFGIVDCDECYYKNYNKHLQLPQPSQQFIERYIESYNKGEVITDVLVEYDWTLLSKLDENNKHIEKEYLKVNPKDNTITIKTIKDNYSREEVEYIILKLRSNIINTHYAQIVNMDIKQWIEENL